MGKYSSDGGMKDGFEHFQIWEMLTNIANELDELNRLKRIEMRTDANIEKQIGTGPWFSLNPKELENES